MPIPEAFYFLESANQLQLQETPTSHIDMDALLAQQPKYWVSPQSPHQKKPKNLILADWRLLSVYPYNITFSPFAAPQLSRLQDKLKMLMQAGFPLYIWDKDKVVPLTEIKLLELGTFRNPIPSPVAAATVKKEAIQQHQLTDSNTMVLDDYWVNCLMTESTHPEPRSLKVSELYNLEKKDLLELLEQLVSATPPLQILYNDFEDFNAAGGGISRFSPQQIVELVKKQFPQIIFIMPVARNYFIVDQFLNIQKDTVDKAICHIEDIPALSAFLESNPTITHLKLIGLSAVDSTLQLSRLPNLTSVESSNLNEKDFQTLLLASPQLENLDIGLNTYHNLFNDERLSLPKLKYVNIAGLSLESFRSLCQVAPNLEVLNIHISKTESEIEMPVLIKLKNLKITGCPNSSFLQRCPNIETLVCDGSWTNASSFPGLAPGSLSLLKSVSLTNTISLRNLKILLTAAPNIEKIAIDEIVIDEEEELTIDSSTFKKLREIELSSKCSIFPFTEVAPQLQTLSYVATAELQQLTLNQLTCLRLKRSHINNSNIALNEVLKKAPRLQTLEFFGTDFTQPEQLPDQLVPLTELSFTENLRNPEEFLKYTPQLKSLAFNEFCEQIEPCQFLLENLEALSFSHSRLKAPSLENLLKATPHVKHLTFTDCSVEVDGSLEYGLLSQLESLQFITVTKDPRPTLFKLLQWAPNIKFLRFNYSLDSFDFPPNSFPFLKVIDMPIKTLSAKTLEKIKAAAPNAIIRQNNPPPYPSESTFQAPNPLDPIHCSQQFREFTPPDPDATFTFNPQNINQNQGMIVNKLSQYLTLTQQHLTLIPKIQVGICGPLSYLFIENPSHWLSKIGLIQQWDGQLPVHQELASLFQDILHVIHPDQFQSSREMYFLGDELNNFLASCQGPCLLANPWHVIGIAPPPPGNDHWTIYDPNFVNGPKQVACEALIATIHRCLGRLITTFLSHDHQPSMDDFDVFLGEGGLLSLIQTDNLTSQLSDLIKKVPNSSKEALEGLLLRSTLGTPAWVIGLQTSKVNTFTKVCLTVFLQKIPDALTVLQKSIAHLPPFQQHAILEQLLPHSPAASSMGAALPNTTSGASSLTEMIEPDTTVLAALAAKIHESSRTAPYEALLTTWKNTKPAYTETNEYLQHCLQPGAAKTRLITCDATKTVDALQSSLRQHAASIHRPVFYIHSPNDITCQSPYVRYENGKGILTKGPGGPLYDFLSSHSDPANPPILIINYANFEPDDMVRFNTLIDKERFADGVAIPQACIIVGLLDSGKPFLYQGADFYSRFDSKEKNPLSFESLQRKQPAIPFTTETIEPTERIALYQATDWKTRLIGGWKLLENEMYFEKGALIQALEARKNCVIIQQGLWENPAFQHFFKEAMLQGYFSYPGGHVLIPDGFSIIRDDGPYQWEELKSAITGVENTPPNKVAWALNPSRLGLFFSQYQCNNETHALTQKAGLLEEFSGQTLSVFLSAELSEHDWARLLNECKKYAIQLHIQKPKEVTLPAELQSVLEPMMTPEELAPSPPLHKTTIIQTTDVDTTTKQLTEEDTLIIDVSELKPADLLKRITPVLKYRGQEPFFEFTEHPGILYNPPPRLILKGHFSLALQDELTQFILTRENKEETNSLILLTEDPSAFPGLVTRHHAVSAAEKLALLPQAPKYGDLETAPLSQLQTRVVFETFHPGKDPWEGMYQLTPNMTAFQAFNPDTAAAETEQFTLDRLTQVNQVLEHSPYVFLTGLSGVGKSTFVEAHFNNDQQLLFLGEEKIRDWATDASPGRKVLFIDEANLSSKAWSEFEGLFNQPPGIFIQGTFYSLTAEHKVIFAGNPCSYGDERKLAPFFARYGQAVVFNPLPPAFIYERIVKPVFEDAELEQQLLTLAAPYLAVYGFLCQYSRVDVLISPREIQMMALLTLVRITKMRQAGVAFDGEAIAKQVAWEVAEPLVPSTLKSRFNEQFKPEPMPAAVKLLNQKYVVTASREPIYRQLTDLLLLRELRQTERGNTQQTYGGLGGIILEGEPAAGKSMLMIETLLSEGYQQEMDFENETRKTKPFYYIPVGLGSKKKEACLLKAFNEGAVVIIDEINSSPMMERLLNQLLMGKAPDGSLPKKPGFLLFGTQNPVTRAGRRVASTALKRRLMQASIPDYSNQELQLLLKEKGVPETEINTLVHTFESKLWFARQHQLSPEPTLRDLIRAGEAAELGLPPAYTMTDETITPESMENQGSFSREQAENQGLSEATRIRTAKTTLGNNPNSILTTAEKRALIDPAKEVERPGRFKF